MNIRDLARKYEPVLLFSEDDQGRDENFFPMSAADYVAESALFRRGDGLVIPRGSLRPDDLAGLGPLKSRDHYLTFAADDVLSQNPGLRDRLVHGGLALFSVEGEVQPQLLVEDSAGLSFALSDPGLERVEAGTGPDDLDPATFAFDTGLDDDLDAAAGESFLITDAMQLPGEVHGRALARYQPYTDFAQHPPVYYYSSLLNRGYLVLHYWFFYAYNDWGSAHGGVNDHEGDWEMIALYFQDEEPTYIAYAAHIGTPTVHRWETGAVEKRQGTHPVVYVGCGSHASYPSGGTHTMLRTFTDFNLGNSQVSIGPGAAVAWGEPADLAAQSWVMNFSGGWGAMVRRFGLSHFAAGAQAPLGPPWQFNRWETPVAWAERVPF
jgi:hypothetical protein